MRRWTQVSRVLLFQLALLSAAELLAKAQTMAVTAELKLEETKLVYQQSTDCTVTLNNASSDFLRDLNPKNLGGGPIILLTDPATGQTTHFGKPKKPGGRYLKVDAAPGKQLEFVFFLTELVQFPRPGTYELQALFQWDAGKQQVTSPHVTVELLPSRPRRAHIVTPTGGAVTTYFAAWLNEPDAGKRKSKYDLWLANISTSTRPRVHDYLHLEEIPDAIQPYLSVAANTSASAHWVAWVNKTDLRFLVHRRGQVSEIMTLKLGDTPCRIVPPLLQNPLRPNQRVPGAEILLYARDQDAGEGTFKVAYVDLLTTALRANPLVVPGPAPDWFETAYVSTLHRLTFLAVPAGDRTALQVCRWSALGMPRPPEDLADWPGTCIGGATWVTQEDLVVGAVVMEVVNGKKRKYRFHTWSMTARTPFEEGPAVPIDVGDGTVIRKALVAVNIGKQPFALLGTDTVGGTWYFADRDGSVRPLPAEIEDFQLPAAVLFRRQLDPTIMYTREDKGFQFAKP